MSFGLDVYRKHSMIENVVQLIDGIEITPALLIVRASSDDVVSKGFMSQSLDGSKMKLKETLSWEDS